MTQSTHTDDTSFATVIPNAPIGPLTYTVPSHLAGTLIPGIAIEVPLGKRHVVAFVLSLQHTPPEGDFKLKSIKRLSPDHPPLPLELLELVIFAADYYVTAAGQLLPLLLPPTLRPSAQQWRLTPEGHSALTQPTMGTKEAALCTLASTQTQGINIVAAEKKLDCSRATANKYLKRAVEKGWLEQIFKRPPKKRKLLAYQRCKAPPTPNTLKISAGLLTLLDNIPADRPLAAAILQKKYGNVYARLKTLLKAELVEQHWLEPQSPETAMASHTAPDTSTLKLSDAQQHVMSQILPAVESQRFTPFLLQGVTGSGKTEVYLRAIEAVLAQQRSALILVPEIALTPQLTARFQSRFGQRVATFHSALTPAERRHEWERVISGEAIIGVGARSALFLPLKNLGFIVVDEEHESSFKQDNMPTYHARDLAVYRAKQNNAVVVLGSATPSLGSWYNGHSGRYHTLYMRHRALDQAMPEVTVLDMTHQPRVGEDIFSESLASRIEQTLSRDQQIILFLNRRGFSPYVYCQDCGSAFRCVDCEVSLTLHRRHDKMVCHYCNYQIATPETCPQCHGHRLRSSGLGTERLEAEIKSMFGSVPTVRLDRDTVTHRHQLQETLNRFHRGDAKIMIGTQMVAKGHDFAGVTLVGIINADTGLNLPDFRAAEKTFQTLTQVAGRAGRGQLKGSVVIQTHQPDHYAIECAQQHDFDSFVTQEKQFREALLYPPFGFLALVRIGSAAQQLAAQHATAVAQLLRQEAQKQQLPINVLGPAPAPLERLKGQWRFQVLLKSPNRHALRLLVSAVCIKIPKHIKQTLEIDPYNML